MSRPPPLFWVFLISLRGGLFWLILGAAGGAGYAALALGAEIAGENRALTPWLVALAAFVMLERLTFAAAARLRDWRAERGRDAPDGWWRHPNVIAEVGRWRGDRRKPAKAAREGKPKPRVAAKPPAAPASDEPGARTTRSERTAKPPQPPPKRKAPQPRRDLDAVRTSDDIIRLPDNPELRVDRWRDTD